MRFQTLESERREPYLRGLLIALVLLSLLGWSYWPTFLEVMERWNSDPQYSLGFVIPLLAVGVVWWRREPFPGWTASFSWQGVLLVVLGMCIRFIATLFFLGTLDVLSLIVVLAGCVLCVGGWPLVRWTAPGLAVLLFTVPTPFRVEEALSLPLRQMATVGSAFMLQVLGLPAIAEGNVIIVNDLRIGVVEACGGLGMMITLFALTSAVALCCERSWWEKALVACSGLPIALLANILRITATGLLASGFGVETADFDQLVGWAMMPVALLLLWLEIKLLDWLIVVEDGEETRGPYYHDVPPSKVPIHAGT
ncbi:MAG: exosortase/archaeosortase family protein [Planctomycetes bacterium]|nr:exosortase/archaeosortase family protein [Planctomycetota bacterium]